MSTLAIEVPGMYLGAGAAVALVVGVGIGMAAPAILAWIEDVIAGLSVVILKLVGWAALAGLAWAVLYAAGVRF